MASKFDIPKYPHLVYPEQGKTNAALNPDTYTLWKAPTTWKRIDTEVVAVTPEVAKKMWERANPKNAGRTKLSWADELTGRMDAGAWNLMDTIEFDDEGNLVNGHHRILAASKSKAVVLFRVVYGATTENYYKYDDNYKRSAENVISIHFGLTKQEAAVLAPATTHIYLYEEGGSLESREYINKEIRLKIVLANGAELSNLDKITINGVKDNPEMVTYLRSIRAITKAAKIKKLPVVESVLLALYTLGSTVNKAQTRDFIKGVITGDSLPADDARLVYRNWLFANADVKGKKRTYTSLKVEKGLAALRAFFDGDTTKLRSKKNVIPRLSPEHDEYFRELAQLTAKEKAATAALKAVEAKAAGVPKATKKKTAAAGD
jgi:hypothetical protein